MSTIGLLRFTRLPNAFTAAADALAGAALASAALGGGRAHSAGTSTAAVAAFFLYAFGVGLNDWSDRERDKTLAPDRPLPSREITEKSALTALFLTLTAALMLAGTVGLPALLAAIFVVAAVWLYDRTLKDTSVPAALALGAARAGAFLLGTFSVERLASGHIDFADPILRVPLRCALAYAILVATLTYLSQLEESSGDAARVRRRLFILLAGYVNFGLAGPRPILLVPVSLAIAAYVVWPAFGNPRKIGPTIGRAVFTFPLATAALSATTGEWSAAGAGVLCLVVSRLFARFLRQRGA